MASQKRAIVYIDGFNLNFSLKGNKWKRYYWLDVEKLSRLLIFPGHLLTKVRYFTTSVRKPPDKVQRQQAFIRAIETLPLVEIIYGKYQYNVMECYKCHHRIPVPKEKKTDVNIAVQMIKDAVTDACDVQYLISGDSDLTPPIRVIKDLSESREVFLLCPPKPIRQPGASRQSKTLGARVSRELISLCDNHRHIKEHHLRACLLPERIETPFGSVIERPADWR